MIFCRESASRLQQKMLEWSTWHMTKFPKEYRPPEVRSGLLRFAPYSMKAEEDNNDVLTFMEDLPAPPSDLVSHKIHFNIHFERSGDVPLYDRATDLVLFRGKKRKSSSRNLLQTDATHETDTQKQTEDKSAAEDVKAGSNEGGAGSKIEDDSLTDDEELQVPAKRLRLSQRCFNCGSYAHALRDCFRVMDPEAIEAGRQEAMGAKSILRSAPKRYFLSDDGSRRNGGEHVDDQGRVLSHREVLEGEFPDVEPGKLSSKAMEALGIRQLDPPPWLSRMQALGLPPAYRGPKPRNSRENKDDEDKRKSDRSSGPDITQGQGQEGNQIDQPCDVDDQKPAADGNDAGAPPNDVSSSSEEDGEVSEDAIDTKIENKDDSPKSAVSNEDGDEGPGKEPEEEQGEDLEDFIGFKDEEGVEDKSANQIGSGTLDAGNGTSGADHVAEALNTSEAYVEFPGINAPIPRGADRRAWGDYPRERRFESYNDARHRESRDGRRVSHDERDFRMRRRASRSPRRYHSRNRDSYLDMHDAERWSPGDRSQAPAHHVYDTGGGKHYYGSTSVEYPYDREYRESKRSIAYDSYTPGSDVQGMERASDLGYGTMSRYEAGAYGSGSRGQQPERHDRSMHWDRRTPSGLSRPYSSSRRQSNYEAVPYLPEANATPPSITSADSQHPAPLGSHSRPAFNQGGQTTMWHSPSAVQYDQFSAHAYGQYQQQIHGGFYSATDRAGDRNLRR